MALSKVKKAEILEPLPHARIGPLIGLLEVIRETEGPDDVYKLSQKLHFELDDLLPITEATEMLGFVRIESGDIEPTPLGLQLSEGDENQRKAIFRKQIEHLPVIHRIVEKLRSEDDHRAGKEFLIEILKKHFSQAETIRQFATALDWGRYAELFGYDPDTEEFFLRHEESEAHPADEEG
jgi:NitT/TauT family transport system ATP-binding protein